MLGPKSLIPTRKPLGVLLASSHKSTQDLFSSERKTRERFASCVRTLPPPLFSRRTTAPFMTTVTLLSRPSPSASVFLARTVNLHGRAVPPNGSTRIHRVTVAFTRSNFRSQQNLLHGICRITIFITRSSSHLNLKRRKPKTKKNPEKRNHFLPRLLIVRVQTLNTTFSDSQAAPPHREGIGDQREKRVVCRCEWSEEGKGYPVSEEL
ncbi:hypothetical protein V8G54_037087 [Vigna mungo]|uniref:Uncharacterized protein n=1 Tax=Vigna mungo TaxID=3915 RepID=A0AAQ3RG33_VIGMU